MQKLAVFVALVVLIVSCDFPDDPCTLADVGDLNAPTPGLIIGHSNGGRVGDKITEQLPDWENASMGGHDSEAWATNGTQGTTRGKPVLSLAQQAQPDAHTIIVILSRRYTPTDMADQVAGYAFEDIPALIDELETRFPRLEKVILAGRVTAEWAQGRRGRNGEPGGWWTNYANMVLAETMDRPGLEVDSMDRWGSREHSCGPLPLGPEHFERDGIHPNPAGAREIARYMVDQLN